MNGFDAAFNDIIRVEGDYSHDPADRGGATAWGITEAVARANGYTGAMHAMPQAVAKRIYRSQYWDLLKLDEVSAIAPKIAAELFDTGVNTGVACAARFLQRALSALGPTVVQQDGVIGPMTLHALREFLALHRNDGDGERVLLAALNAQQALRYMGLAEDDPTQHRFIYGWIRNRVVT